MASFTPQPGTVHEYAPRLQAFELTPPHANANPSNAIIFIGGLTDGLLTVPFIVDLNKDVPSNWSVFQIIFSSSYQGWGTGSLDRDVKEINLLVKYLKEKLGKKKVVLLGHSTGTQDSIHYSLTKDNEGIDGIILQAPVSDREAIAGNVGETKLKELNEEAKEILLRQGKDRVLPKKFSDIFFGTPISAYRWLSLADFDGDDDYFSTDLADSKLKATFGKLSTKVLILYSGNDEFAKEGVDKEILISRWKGFVKEGLWSEESKVVPGGSHNLAGVGQEPIDIVVGSVVKFITQI